MIEDIRNPFDEVLDMQRKMQELEKSIEQMADKLNEVISCVNELEKALKNVKKDRCSTCKHYDADYGDTCLNPSGTCRVFEYDGYEPKGE